MESRRYRAKKISAILRRRKVQVKKVANKNQKRAANRNLPVRIAAKKAA